MSAQCGHGNSNMHGSEASGATNSGPGPSEITIAGVRLGPVPDHYGLHNGAVAT